MRKKVTVFIPDNLDLLKVSETHPLPSFPGFSIDKLTYVAGLVFRLAGKGKKSITESGYAKIHSSLFKSHVRAYKSYLTYLVSSGVLECDGRYYEKKPLGYRFSETYRGMKSVQVTLDVRKDKKKKNKDLLQTHRHLTKWVTDPGLTIMRDDALRFVEEARQRSESVLVAKPDSMYEDIDLSVYNPNYVKSYVCGIASVISIAAPDRWSHVDDKGFRLHTPLTSMKKEIRKFVRYCGKRLVALDIVNSQPYFSLCLFNPSFFDSRLKTEFNIFQIYKNVKKTISLPSPLIPLLRQQLFRFIDCQDVKQYVELVSGGQLYERLGTEFEKSFVNTMPDRSLLKKSVFVVMFSDNRYIGQDEEGAAMKRRFRDLFPNVYNLFAMIKKHDSSALACLLQAIESHVILRVICSRISKERPEVPLFTIHDSIATTEENLEYVRKVMVEELVRHVGFEPAIRAEPWF